MITLGPSNIYGNLNANKMNTSQITSYEKVNTKVFETKNKLLYDPGFFDLGYEDSYFDTYSNSNGTAINSVSSSYPCYIGNGEIVYRNSVDTFLYKKYCYNKCY